MVNYNNKRYYIDVVEAKPGRAVSIVDTDCEVDFAPPLDYVEPERPAPAPAPTVPPKVPSLQRVNSEALEEKPEEAKGFLPFVGSGNRLDGKAASTFSSTSSLTSLGGSESSSSLQQDKPAGMAAGKVVLGSSLRKPGELKKPGAMKKKKEKAPEPEPEPKFKAFSGAGNKLK